MISWLRKRSSQSSCAGGAGVPEGISLEGWKGLWGLILLTPNCHVAEEEPATDEGFLGAPGGPVHDVQVWRVEAQGCGREPISHQVHPQQLHRDQGLGQPQGGCQEDAARRRRSHVHPAPRPVVTPTQAWSSWVPALAAHQTTSPTLEEMR